MLQLLADVAKHNGEQFDTEEWTRQSSRQIDPPQQTVGIDCGVFVSAYATPRQQEYGTNLFHQTYNQRERLYMANVILGDMIAPITMTIHLPSSQPKN